MSDPLTLPLLAMPQVQAARPADSSSPDSQVEATAAAPSAPSFAEVLKAKSDAGSDDAGEDVLRPAAAEDAALLAFMAGIPLPADSLTAPQLLAKLKGDKPELTPASIPEAREAAAPGLDLRADVAPGTEMAAAPSDAVATVMAAAPQTTTTVAPSALPAALPAAAPATQPAFAVPPAPTLASARALAAGPAVPAVADRTTKGSSEPAGGMSPRQALIAGVTANSADAGKVGGDILAAEATGDFRPLLDRLIDHQGNAATQAAPSTAATPPPAPANTVQIRLATPFADAAWAQEVDQKLNWIVTSARQQADLILNPPDLGRIEVTLVVKGDEVNASFASPHQAVRDAIEESLIRLRESLAESGISLGQTHVGRDSSRDAPFLGADSNTRQARELRQEAGIALRPASAWMPAQGRGMVDVFA